jgi:hypothetical protein
VWVAVDSDDLLTAHLTRAAQAPEPAPRLTGGGLLRGKCDSPARLARVPRGVRRNEDRGGRGLPSRSENSPTFTSVRMSASRRWMTRRRESDPDWSRSEWAALGLGPTERPLRPLRSQSSRDARVSDRARCSSRAPVWSAWTEMLACAPQRSAGDARELSFSDASRRFHKGIRCGTASASLSGARSWFLPPELFCARRCSGRGESPGGSWRPSWVGSRAGGATGAQAEQRASARLGPLRRGAPGATIAARWDRHWDTYS